MAGPFQGQLDAFHAKAMKYVDQVRRASILELFRLVIMSTPVDTGRLRGNWQTTINAPAVAELDRLDPNGGIALAEVLANMGGLLDVVYFSNNLPYAERIEYDGYSAQAPEGMVRRHVAMWGRIVEAKARGLAN